MTDEERYFVFSNHFGEGATDFSYLSPEEAKEEMDERKSNGEYISSEDWFGYQQAIAAKNDDKYEDEILGMPPEDVHTWFMKKYKSGSKLTTKIWLLVHESVSIMHESFLTEALQSVEPKKVRSWVADMKNEGYFFSEIMYSRALERYDSWYKRKK